MLFIFAAEILGGVQEFYVLVPHWDTVLHTINGFLFAAIGFSIMNILSNNKLVSIMALIFADGTTQTFHLGGYLDMGLQDTMKLCLLIWSEPSSFL